MALTERMRHGVMAAALVFGIELVIAGLWFAIGDAWK